MYSSFNSIDKFIAALNDYDGADVWRDMVYPAKIKGNKIDFSQSSELNGEIYFDLGQVILYHELGEVWVWI